MKIGILGAGQLGRMLALAGYPLGLEFVFIDPTPAAPAGRVAEQIVADYDDDDALEQISSCNVVTYEFESVPAASAERLAERVPVYPPARALRVAQDRLHEKSRFQDLGIPTPRFAAVDSENDLRRAVEHVGLPAVLKTRTLGYDGKGQFVLRQASDVGRAWDELGGVPLILEEFVRFERELSVLAVRSTTGQLELYPLIQNEHRDGILHLSLAPAPDVPAELQQAAESYARLLLENLDYVGVLALELFQIGNTLLANEIAPRVHNSGHWTIEGAEVSQFENHLRAVLGLPLGSTRARGYSAMLNLVGTIPASDRILQLPSAHLHLYGKEPRAGRKLGHVTLCCNSADERREQIDALIALLA